MAGHIFLAGDCIYIPAGWVFQSNIVSVDNSLELKWKPEPWTPDEECVKGFTKRMLSTITFPGENYRAVDTTKDYEEVLAKELKKVMDKVLTNDRRKLNDQFNFEALKVIQVKNRRFEHTLSKFAQQSEDPINRNFNFEAFRVIQDFSGHHG